MADQFTSAVVTGASRGFGRAVAGALAARGVAVVGIARGEQDLRSAAEEFGDNFTPLVGDATDEGLARRVLAEHRPGLLVLNAGAVPHVAPVQEQTWESFSINWHNDTRHAFTWTKAALLAPLAPGSVVVEVSSGAAIGGSPLSGGYASAKAAVRYIRQYGADESERGGLGIRFVSLLPGLSPSGVGSVGVDAYAARSGLSREVFVEKLGPVLTPDLVAAAVLQLADDAGSGPEYTVDGSGLHAID
ncbi:SDR family NAD(P)-dependent oxidoreductase [Actinomadura rupiterrae]|uniref:SDR family NAD(P)-dependent oxidoreductase n=1 Tax=Actinomadura rupiterrae TaxID=559627 RepID=UPI0020A2D740|nr:SDR family oxidoreductase [Actinomadura rupiterrae]MCP2339333.1 NAD(P)-dependent dehydrogenase (short-subunit alcohol dehydrogenase family) [Actinomadura rupiterrae]